MREITSKNEDRAFYGSVHYWLKHNFGVADRCENIECKQISVNYDWALKKGKKYGYKRESFFRLCHSCHKTYDVTPSFRKKMKALNKNAHKTHCLRGHPLSGDNLLLLEKKSKNASVRLCRICVKIRLTKWQVKHGARWQRENRAKKRLQTALRSSGGEDKKK